MATATAPVIVSAPDDGFVDSGSSPPRILDATSCRMPEEHNRLKGFLGTAHEITTVAEVVAPKTVAWVRSLSDAEIIPMGEKAIGDIADNILVLDEIRQRFRKGLPILGYTNWSDFVERNSKFSLRTVQRRLNEVNGKDESKVNKPETLEARRTATRVSVPLTPAQLKTAEALKKHLPALHEKVVTGKVTLRNTDRPARQTRYTERDFYARVGRTLNDIFSPVDERLQELVHIKKSDWCPEAEEGIKRLLMNLSEVSKQADKYAAALKKVLKANKDKFARVV
jgi:hypothetical protein